MAQLSDMLRSLLGWGDPVAEVQVLTARGSTPREAGVRMLVTPSATFGTVGGGRLEWEAIAGARRLLESGEASARLEMPLGPAVGQCCGGYVVLSLRRADEQVLAELVAAERAAVAAQLPVLLFGAGHVGQAMATALSPLPFNVRWIDNREGLLDDEMPFGIEPVAATRPVDEVAGAPAGAAYLVLTHSHALDFEICAAVLERGDFGYLGLIGSATKRARFERGFRELGIAKAQVERLVCPIGGSLVRDKRPPVIAALVAAELLTRFAGAMADTPQPALADG
jgi:xanthine dehydrogenase accessory protein XdhC